MSKGGTQKVEEVPKHEKGKVLTAKYLENIEKAIKGRTPVAGKGVEVIYTDGASTISVSVGAFGATPVGLTICSGGQPTVITVFGLT